MSYVNGSVALANVLTSRQTGKAARGAAESQALQLGFQADAEDAAALETAKVIRRAGARQVSQAKAAYAGAGVKVGEGTAQLVENEIEQNVEHDAFQALLTGQRRANSMRTQADLARISGKVSQTAAEMNGINSALAYGNQAMKASGWRTNGPGFSGGQQAAPVVNRDIKVGS